MALHDSIDSSAPDGAPHPRGDGRVLPEATPTEEALATLQGLRDSRPELAPQLDPVLATVEALQMEVSGLRYALTGRATIDEAKGILMAGRGCNEETAFEILKRLSQDTNVTVRDVARAIVYGAQGTD